MKKARWASNRIKIGLENQWKKRTQRGLLISTAASVNNGCIKLCREKNVPPKIGSRIPSLPNLKWIQNYVCLLLCRELIPFTLWKREEHTLGRAQRTRLQSTQHRRSLRCWAKKTHTPVQTNVGSVPWKYAAYEYETRDVHSAKYHGNSGWIPYAHFGINRS